MVDRRCTRWRLLAALVPLAVSVACSSSSDTVKPPASARTTTSVSANGPSTAETQPSRTCEPSDYRLGVSSQGATGNIAIGGGVAGLVHGSPCNATVSLELRLEDDAGHLLSIRGNPATATIEGSVTQPPLPAGGLEFSAAWFWGNWCAPIAPVVEHLSDGHQEATNREVVAPPCVASGSPSQLLREH